MSAKSRVELNFTSPFLEKKEAKSVPTLTYGKMPGKHAGSVLVYYHLPVCTIAAYIRFHYFIHLYIANAKYYIFFYGITECNVALVIKGTCMNGKREGGRRKGKKNAREMKHIGQNV